MTNYTALPVSPIRPTSAPVWTHDEAILAGYIPAIVRDRDQYDRDHRYCSDMEQFPVTFHTLAGNIRRATVCHNCNRVTWIAPRS